MLGDRIQQLRNADAAARIREQNRHDVRLIHRPFERGVQDVVIRLLAAEILLHQRVIQLDDLIENSRVRLGRRERISLSPSLFSRHSTTALPPPAGKIDRQTFVAERFLNLCDQRFQIDFRQIDLVDDDRRGADLATGDFHHPPGDDFDPALRVDDDDYGLHRRQAAMRVADQIRAARRVDEVDPLAEVIRMQDGRVDRMPVFLFLLFEIAEAAPVGHGALVLDGPAGKEHGIDQRGFPAAAVADEDGRF